MVYETFPMHNPHLRYPVPKDAGHLSLAHNDAVNYELTSSEQGKKVKLIRSAAFPKELLPDDVRKQARPP